MQTSQLTEAIDAALAEAQGELNPAPKASINPHYKSKFADLATCVEVSRPILAKYGLSITQSVIVNLEQNAAGVGTRLSHKSGQWYYHESWCRPAKGLDPQSVGAAATYLRRYSYSAVIGLVTEEDDDGNSISHGGHQSSDVSEFKVPFGKFKDMRLSEIDATELSNYVSFLERQIKETGKSNPTTDNFVRAARGHLQKTTTQV